MVNQDKHKGSHDQVYCSTCSLKAYPGNQGPIEYIEIIY